MRTEVQLNAAGLTGWDDSVGSCDGASQLSPGIWQTRFSDCAEEVLQISCGAGFSPRRHNIRDGMARTLIQSKTYYKAMLLYRCAARAPRGTIQKLWLTNAARVVRVQLQAARRCTRRFIILH